MNAYNYLLTIEAEFIQKILKDGEAIFSPTTPRPEEVNPGRIGHITKRLADCDLITKIGAAASTSATRHRGLVVCWRVQNREGLKQRLRFLPKAKRKARRDHAQMVLPILEQGD